ncbi:exported protein of unknown function [Pseudomonas sp. JV551A1]|uniref:Uncharacterized protein n=1 Tax=Pseudomonas inefficax TaxID=2078786 RepID=A0AAQ1SRR1_9PSED|nr:exported protein of unknown function [Pseudomonas sp. JV551A1]SPO58863.1 exported protein of unknown function [Pseudomonas inefficax]
MMTKPRPRPGFFFSACCTTLGSGAIPVGAALCRDRAAERPRQFKHDAEILGPLRSPIATQGRSYKEPQRLLPRTD